MSKTNTEASCNKESDYNSDEDLEHLMKVTIIKKKNIEKSNISQSSIDSDENNSKYCNIKVEKVKKDSSWVIRLLNISSVLLLLITFFTTSISKMNSNNNYDILMDYLRRDKIQTEGNLLILYIAFLFVTCKIFI